MRRLSPSTTLHIITTRPFQQLPTAPLPVDLINALYLRSYPRLTKNLVLLSTEDGAGRNDEQIDKDHDAGLTGFVTLHFCPYGATSSGSLHRLRLPNIGRGPAQDKTSPLALTIPRRFVALR